MSYSVFRGAAKVSETTYEYDDGALVRSVTTTEPDWTEQDRGLVLALVAERSEICPMCNHPMSQCRDPRTAGSWEPIEEICQASRVAQAAAENANEKNRRGVAIKTRRRVT